MKNFILTSLFSIICPENYKIEVLTNLVNDHYLKINLKNTSNKSIYFFYGHPINVFKIEDDNNNEPTGKVTSISSEEDYLDFQYDYSENFIKNTMSRYKISFQEALIYLHYRHDYVIVPAKQCKTLNLKVLKRNYTTQYKLDSTKTYYLSAEIKFSDVYIPEYVKDSLENNNIEIIKPNIKTEKITIDIKKFFRKKNGYFIR
ncbi:hypothetical protein [Epilithonimonas caeni]|uniref:hypothetical protein n=1 Tax=Epilithonimonas caeni TaxID=365343 RepID=UPI0003FD2DD7|nr:hypothetical protein [Epilithonimonas caeni]